MRNLKTSICQSCTESFQHGSDVRGKFCCIDCSSNYKRKLYEKRPNSCNLCKIAIPYEGRLNKFCSRSCAATNTNNTRDKSYLDKLRATWSDKPETKKDISKRKRDSRKTICVTCYTEFKPSYSQKYCTTLCRALTSKQRYRAETRFKLNKKDHGSLFDASLISKYGWYCASNKGIYNPKGVTWDHLFRVEDGYKLKVDPKIMKHPANAELLPWTVNKARRTSIITYEELLRRICLWDNGNYDELEYFFTD